MTAVEPVSGLQATLRSWASRARLGNALAMALAIGAALAALATYALLTGSLPFVPATPTNVLILIYIDLVFLLLLGVVIARRVVRLWGERRRGMAGAGLHTRLVLLFGVVAVVPTIVVATFSLMFVHLGLLGWFSEQVETALNRSREVAEAYLEEHGRVVVGDTLAMANDLNRGGQALFDDPERLQRLVETQRRLRSLSEAVVFDATGKVLARAGEVEALAQELVPESAVETARRGEVAVVMSSAEDRLRGLVELAVGENLFLYVGRAVEPAVLDHLAELRTAVASYASLQDQRREIELTFALIFATVALLFLLAAIWVGLHFATGLARPLSRLVEAAERVRGGDLSVRVEDSGQSGELQSLSRAFNRMTQQLGAHRQELVDANRQLDERRRFTEAVLAGVAAGVIGLDEAGNIRYPNRTAGLMLSVDLGRYIDLPLATAVPEMQELIDEARRHPHRQIEHQVDILRDGAHKTLLTRVTVEAEEGRVRGYVVTFTDITELLAAQRKAAWSDIARRIAHEIKNPLTPIQLSAERLRRKYLKEVRSDPQVFEMCTDTIVRQVEDLRRLVDEFSAFARMPRPTLEPADLAAICRDAMALQTSAGSAVSYRSLLPDAPVRVICDQQQIGQVLTNLLLNATDAVAERAAREPDAPQEVTLRLEVDDDKATASVEDTGIGLPESGIERLTEPYVTTKEKGTGLGLAIVRRIMDDHDGELVLENRTDGGARAAFSLALDHSASDMASSIDSRAVAAGGGRATGKRA